MAEAHVISLTEVIVDSDRFRRSFSEIDELANSFRRVGQIQPITLDENNHLVVGERRLRAARLLNWKTIKYVTLSELDDVQRKIVELEENIRRQDLTWQERCRAKLELHRAMQQQHGESGTGKKGGWRLQDTANALSESLGSVSMDINLALAAEKDPTLYQNDKKTTAYKALERSKDSAVREIVARVLSEDQQSKDEATEAQESSLLTVLQGDCLELLTELESGLVDLVIFDPLWMLPKGSKWLGREVSEEEAVVLSESTDATLLDNSVALQELQRVMRPNSHMYLFFASKYYTETLTLVKQVGFEFDPVPLIWYKHKAMNLMAYQKFTYTYEPILFVYKGSRKLNSVRSCVFDFPGISGPEKMHVTEKPHALMSELIEVSTVTGELVLDPMMGSGVVLEAARDLKRRGIGMEKDAETYIKAMNRLKGVVNGRSSEPSG